MKRRPCPTPTKKRWRDRAPAEREAENLARRDQRRGDTEHACARVYYCACGGFHLTSKPREVRGPLAALVIVDEYVS